MPPVSSQTDANTEMASSATQDANKGGASSSIADAKQTFDEQAMAQFAKETPVSSEGQEGSSPAANGQDATAQAEGQTEGAEAKKSDVLKSDSTEEGKGTNEPEKKEDKTESEAKAEPAKVEDEKLDFHKHPRFQELLKESKTGKEFMEKAQPVLDRMEKLDQFLTANGIVDKQFIDALQTVALVNTDPKAARQKLQGLIDYLDGFTGSKLPEDLSKKVEAGTLSREDAQEIASLRSQQQFQGQRSQRNEAQTHQQQVYQALTHWEQTMQSKDVDYSRKQQQVNSRYVALVAQEQMRTGRTPDPTAHVKLAQQAYDEVNSFVSSFIPKPTPTSKTLATNGSRTTAKTEPKKWDEVEDFLVSNFGR